MNREAFIESCRTLTDAELLEIAQQLRRRASGRIPPETQLLFRALDALTDVEEKYIQTSFGQTHVYLVRPRTEGVLPVLINVHGGGWSLDHTERDIYFCRRMAHRLHCLVVDVDYVLAPEHPYPAALEEMEALFSRLPELMPTWGGDPARVVCCGQSAGGNLVGAVLQRRRFDPKLRILSQVLCYLPTDNYNDHFHGQELDERGMSTEYYGFFYNRCFDERRNADVSLLFAEDDDLRGLPPTHIITAGMDNLLEEGRAYYELLQRHGIPATYRCFEHSRHGFLVNLYDEWREGEDALVETIGRCC